MTTMLQEKIGFERVTGIVGARVKGVALGVKHDASTADTLRRALHEHGVLFFEYGEAVSAADFVAFGELFGEPEETYRLTLRKGDSPYIDSDMAPMKDVRINCWHSDGTVFEHPPQAAMLTPVELPEVGGDTMWASMYAAWEGLSSHIQNLLDGLQVVHSTARLPFLRETRTTVHPAVIKDSITGRKMLFVNSNYSERFVGMSDRESDALLRMLFEHTNTPEYHVRLKWRLGTIAVWEERVTQHRGVADFTGPRKLRRITFIGDRPSA